MTSATAFMLFNVSITSSSRLSFTRSILFSKILSANATCCTASFTAPSGFSSAKCRPMCFASARHRIESILYASAISGLMKNVNATGAGSARPVVSMMTWSNFFARSFSVRSALTKSPRTVQHTHPLSIVMMFSFSLIFSPTSASSMDTAPNSFSMTAMSFPWSPFRMWFTRVVFPAPRNPVTIVTGSFSASEGPSMARVVHVWCACVLRVLRQ
mmetsp:Transcript_10004/g.36345  ORF Transcript_10004/g.36345 Transcript_10004/m.36345 type:complete len:214 (+) Transcript_10004:703-1344(+)